MTKLEEIGQACLDWVKDMGTCHLCGFDEAVPAPHDPECLVLLYLASAPEKSEMPETTTEVDWHRDQAASGWRSRTWLPAVFMHEPWGLGMPITVEQGWELIAYDTGDWEVRGPPDGFTLASGTEPTAEAAKRKAISVQKALVARTGSGEASDEATESPKELPG